MRLGVLSDTHGNLDYLHRVVDIMQQQFQVQAIIHLGDDLRDAREICADGIMMFAVPGMYEGAWQDDRVPHRMLREFGDVSFILSHTPTRDSHDRTCDINPGRALSRYGAEVLLHGHTHRPSAMRAVDGLIVICPGHLKSALDRGMPPTFAIIDVERPNLKVEFVNLQGEILAEKSFRLGATPESREPSLPEEFEETSIA